MSQPHEVSLLDQLTSLAHTAMQEATPLMTAVATALESDAGRYVNAQAGLKLLQASVLLHLRTNEVGLLIDRWGVDKVSDAFITLFDRPIIESEQISAFAEVGTDSGWTAYSEWARLLWNTIENQPAFIDDVVLLTDKVFHHDKGYNRAVNFATEPAVRALMTAPTLAEAIAAQAQPAATTTERAMWLYRVLCCAELIPRDDLVGLARLNQIVDEHRAELESGLGMDLGDDAVTALTGELGDYGIVNPDA